MFKFAALLALSSPQLAAAGTVDLTQQVRLLDASGNPITGAHTVSVQLVSDSDPLPPETVCHTAALGTVTFQDGFATLPLTTTPTACFLSPQWVAVSVDGAELGPRVPVRDVPRAGVAQQVPTSSTPGACGTAGELLYDTANASLLVCDGAAWGAAGTSSSVGDVRESLLTEAQFQTQNGTGWVLMDGRDITGSTLATLTGMTAAPDARGVVLRGKNNGRAGATGNPDGDLAVGAYQADAYGSHSHPVVANPHTGGAGGTDGPAAFNQGYPINGLGPTSFVVNSVQTRAIPYGRLLASAVGANETRMRNITVNVFLRID